MSELRKDRDAAHILANGRVWRGPDAVLEPRRANNCHQNVAVMCHNDDTIVPVTGYALAKDGMWRSHSWALRGTQIVETTRRWVMYFGATMPRKEWMRRELGPRLLSIHENILARIDRILGRLEESTAVYPNGTVVPLRRGKELLRWSRKNGEWTTQAVPINKVPREAVELLRQNFYAFEYNGQWEGLHTLPEYLRDEPVYSVASGPMKAVLRESKVLATLHESAAPRARRDLNRANYTFLSDYETKEQAWWFGRGTRFATSVPHNGRVRVYRATPEGYPIQPGDYVTQSRAYAKWHIESNLDGDGKITELVVGLDELTPADGQNEFWYIPR